MESTRTSIRDTVGELRGKVGETLDWRHYVNRYPGASLTLAVAVGMVVGRGVATLVLRRDGGAQPERYGYGGYDPRLAESFGESGLTTTEARAQAAYESREHAAGSALSGARRAVGQSLNQSVGRLGSRLEAIVNRLIDDVAEAVETTAVPAFTAWVRDLLEAGAPGAARRSSGVGRRRSESEAGGAVYPGGPAGRQSYPPPTPRASEGF